MKSIKTLLIIQLFPFLIPAQTVDSLKIKFYYQMNFTTNHWENNFLIVDSFSAGLQKSRLIQDWNGFTFMNSQLDSYSYTGAWLDEKVTQTWNSNQWNNLSRWVYIQSALPDSAIKQKWNSVWENDILNLTWKNSINLDSIKIDYKWINSAWILRTKTEYDYSPDSTLFTETFSTWDTTALQWNYTGRNLYDYSNHVLNSMIEQNYTSGNWTNYLGYWDGYTFEGQVGWASSGEWSNADSAFSITHSSGFANFDSTGHVIYVYRDNTPGGYGETTWTYDSLGNPATQHHYGESMGGNASEDSIVWFYLNFPSPTINIIAANDTLTSCSGDSIPPGIIAFGGSSPLHYQWTPSTGLSSDTIANPLMAPGTDMTYNLSVSDDSSNIANYSIYIHINPLPTATITSIDPTCIGCGDGMFIVNGQYTFMWLDTSGYLVSGDTILGLAAGEYVISIVDSNECENHFTDTIFSPSTGLSEIRKMEISIYPNPVSQYFFVSTNVFGEDVRLNVYDVNGRIVFTEILLEELNKFESTGISNGIYVAKIQKNDSLAGTFQFIVDKK